MSDQSLRDHLLWLLDGGDAHISFEAATANMPFEAQGRQAEGFPHTPWQLLEHLRICQWDILEFSRTADHVSPEFPTGYWPTSEAPPNENAWRESVARFEADAEQLRDLVRTPSVNLYAPFPWGTGQTLLREVLLVADHNAYHLGQLILVRKALNAWEPPSETLP